MNKNIEYKKLERELFKKIIILILLALFLVFIIYLITDNAFGNFIVKILERRTGLDEYSAYTFYNNTFRKYKFIIYGISLIIIGIIMIKVLISIIINYFLEIEKGVDNLLMEDNLDIILSQELSPLENKLNLSKFEIKKRKQELVIAEQQKNDLIVYLAHDIKTPLTSVLGYLQLLSETQDLPQKQREKYTNIALEKGLALEKLINEFFEITRYNLHDINLNKKDINISFMLDQIIDEFYPLLKNRNKNIITEYQDNIYAKVDGNQLARAESNIVKNAINYSYPKTDIIVKSWIDNEYLYIETINSGDNISEVEKDNIFSQFYRIDKARQSKTGGSGLGLSISDKIVKAHNGKILIESENNINKFIIKIPL